MRTSLNEILVESADAGLTLLDAGQMPAGHNGPHDDPETPVRNSAHWVMIFLKAYKIDGDEQYLEAAKRLANYLCSDTARPYGKTFYHRDQEGKDSCNGLIGQAWTIEALAEIAPFLEDPSTAQVAEEVFLLHPFDKNWGLWERVDVDGTVLSKDMTFNHQLWFAACASLLPDTLSDSISTRVEAFLDSAGDRLELYESGLIRHPVAYRSRWRNYARSLRNRLRDREDRSKCVGYHAFNLYAFALLKEEFPDHQFWSTDEFQRALTYVESDEYKERILDSKYGYPYNPPGFEVAFALHTFDRGSNTVLHDWIASQLNRCFDRDSGLMTRNTPDKMTHAARLYEATRLPDIELELKQYEE